MKLFFCFTVFLLTGSLTSAQVFQFNKISRDKIDSIEKLNNSVRFIYDYPIGVSGDYFPDRKKYNLNQPIVYRKGFDKYYLETSYYTSRGDSSLRLIEYWWCDTTYSLNFTDTIVKKNKQLISAFFNSKGKTYPENKDYGERTIWANKHYYVQQFPVAEGLRVLISWR